MLTSKAARRLDLASRRFRPRDDSRDSDAVCRQADVTYGRYKKKGKLTITITLLKTPIFSKENKEHIIKFI